MTAQQTAFTEQFCAGHPNSQVIIASAQNGGMTIAGPARINARATQKLADDTGIAWSVELRQSGAQCNPRLCVHELTAWYQPSPVTALSKIGLPDGIREWASKVGNLSATVTLRPTTRTGSVLIVRVDCTGRLHSSHLSDLMSSPRVVNVWVDAAGLDIWLAKETVHRGGLFHLAATGKLSTRFGPKSKRGKERKAPRRKRILHTRKRAPISRTSILPVGWLSKALRLSPE